MVKLGVTGGIGSGKSAVCRILECLGVPVFRADDEGRRLLLTNEVIRRQVTDLFGSAALTGNKPDPKKIASVVFADATKLAALNNIIHPAVRDAFNRWSSQFPKTEVVAEEAAILLESGAGRYLDRILLVTAPQDLRIMRVMQRDKISREEVIKRMDNQWDDVRKIGLANYIITNDDNTLLIPQVIDVLNRLGSGNHEINS